MLPISIWANQITGIKNDILIFKNIMIDAEATSESVLDIKEILETIKK